MSQVRQHVGLVITVMTCASEMHTGTPARGPCLLPAHILFQCFAFNCIRDEEVRLESITLTYFTCKRCVDVESVDGGIFGN